MTTTVVFFTTTGAQTWSIPAGVTSLQIECVGAGQDGTAGVTATGGNGGKSGGYSTVTSLAVTGGNTLWLSVGAHGSTGGDSWANAASNAAPTTTSQGALAKGGNSASTAVGNTINAGGAGGTGASSGGGGGSGGTGGPTGAGATGSNGVAFGAGGAGGKANGTAGPVGGVGGSGFGIAGTAGTAATLWTATAGGTAGVGSGSGGGGPDAVGTNGDLYGTGGSGGGGGAAEAAGLGVQGIIVITYTTSGGGPNPFSKGYVFG